MDTPDFLLKNLDFLMKNPDSLLKIVDFILLKQVQIEDRRPVEPAYTVRFTLFLYCFVLFCTVLY